MEPRPAQPAAVQTADDLGVEDLLADSFALIPNEAEWLIQLLGPELGRLLDDKT